VAVAVAVLVLLSFSSFCFSKKMPTASLTSHSVILSPPPTQPPNPLLTSSQTFADECGVPQLRACFRPLRQLLDAILDKRAATILGDEATRMSLFPQLDAGDAVAVLEKVVGLGILQSSRMNNLLGGGGGGGSGGLSGRDSSSSGGSGRDSSGCGSDLPQLDKKQATELIKLLLQAS
jgi:hypothetical protein